MLPNVRSLLIAVTVGATLIASGCFRRSRPASNPPIHAREVTGRDFVDFAPGWTIQVVVPVLRSGGYVLPSVRNAAANDFNLEAGDDFLGYEKALYKVKRRGDGGIQLQFIRADLSQNGKVRRQKSPSVDLFREAAKHHHVRLVFLIRQSQADHNSAIVAADDFKGLDLVTRTLTETAKCQTNESGSCEWVPEGISVIPDERPVRR